MKELKDYLHLYIGCKVIIDNDLQDTDHELIGVVAGSDCHLHHGLHNQYGHCDISKVKPILRPLSSITENERKEIFYLIFKKKFPISGSITFYDNTNISNNPRYVLWSGVDRVCVDVNGNVWADCDLHPYKYNQHQITMYLLSKHFDLFSLIEADLALDATKIKES